MTRIREAHTDKYLDKAGLIQRHEALAIIVLFVAAATLFWTVTLGFSPEMTLTFFGLGVVTAFVECGSGSAARNSR